MPYTVDIQGDLTAIEADVGQKQRAPPPLGDGTALEATASVKWVNYRQGIQIEDPLFVTMITRLLNLLEEKHDRITRHQSEDT